MRPLMLGVLLAFLPAERTADAAYCYRGWVSGYVRTDHSGRTFDGTAITTREPIAAAGWDIPIDSVVEIADVGRFRVADRGRLANGQVDLAVWTRSEAYRLTGTRDICVYPPG
jgi:3D (Asp-Asp-Asp) domain-containing protein